MAAHSDVSNCCFQDKKHQSVQNDACCPGSKPNPIQGYRHRGQKEPDRKRYSCLFHSARLDQTPMRKADYALFCRPDIPIAAVEAKDNKHGIGAGMPQAIEYPSLHFTHWNKPCHLNPRIRRLHASGSAEPKYRA
jgi:hypothetical protein